MVVSALVVLTLLSSPVYTGHPDDPWKARFRHLGANERAWAKSTSRCETGGTFSPTIHDPSGTYHGAFQFDMTTARAAGFKGDPHTKTWFEQAVRAVRYRRRVGSSPWPVCG